MSDATNPLVGVIMGSQSDWDTMQHAAAMLTKLGVPHETRVVSAHRTPDLLFEYAGSAASRGLRVIIAGAGGAGAESFGADLRHHADRRGGRGARAAGGGSFYALAP
jgi:phosphoribosylcarboxyaminoimidazole (NCAIR) mutase